MSKKSLIINGKVLYNHQFVETDVIIADGKIVSVDKQEDRSQYDEIIDAKGNFVLPGFIDIHTHGGNGIDINHASKEDMLSLSEFFATKGVTSYLPTILTDTHDKMCELLGNIVAAQEEQIKGAQILGIHMEGPFLCIQYKGAMPEELILDASVEDIKAYQKASKNTIKYMTVSPENKGIKEVITYLKEQGIVASMGHTGADYDTCISCIEAGISSSTHVFNAMGAIHQHRPDAIGASLESDIYSEMICDGFHLHPGIVRLMIKAKGIDKAIAVTDSIMAAGLEDGNYKLGVNDIVVIDGDAQVAGTGVRAGSTLTMDKATRNLMRFSKRPLEEVSRFLSTNPATMLGIEGSKGDIAVGKDADLVILSQEYSVIYTIINGEVAYKN
ncbi:MAG: N-acetylglucosamine-6-phosphate deacetylase [Cellulosilyticaceae bacterium]